MQLNDKLKLEEFANQIGAQTKRVQVAFCFALLKKKCLKSLTSALVSVTTTIDYVITKYLQFRPFPAFVAICMLSNVMIAGTHTSSEILSRGYVKRSTDT